MMVVLTAEKPVAGGRMLARHDGQVVLVAGAIPGERVQARIERTAKQLAYADTIEVLDPSPDRRQASADWACGGSMYAHIEYSRQLTLKSELIADAFARIAKHALPNQTPVMASQESGYRMRARLHARDGRFGFFREGSHELCDAEATHQLLPATIDAMTRLESALAANRIRGVASCEIAENAAATERAVLVEIDDAHSAPVRLEPIADISGLVFGDRLTPRLTVAYGSPFVVDEIATPGVAIRLTHHVKSFFQGNRYLVPAMLERVVSQVPDGEVVDLYAGVGLFSVALAARGRNDVTAVEGDHSSVRDLEANAAPYAGRLRVEHASVERYVRRKGLRQPDTLLIDPPRTGMSREALSGAIVLEPARIVYVSCDVPTLARDAKRLIEAGYRLEHIEAFDMFPNTAHVETLAVFNR